MRHKHGMQRTRALFTTGILLVGGCGIADAIRDLKALTEIGIDDGASAGEEKSAVASPDSATMLELGTGAKLAVPAGAVDEDITLSMERPADEEAIGLIKTLSADDKAASAPYILTPHGTQFKKSVEVTLPVAKGRDQEKLAVMWLEDEQDTTWEKLGVPVVSDGEAKIALNHFSVLVLVEEGAGPGVGDQDEPARPGTSEPGDEDPRFDAGVGPGSSDGEGPVSADGDFQPPDECKSDFDCATTTFQCGVFVDGCGVEHDVVAECPEFSGCGELGECVVFGDQGSACAPGCVPYQGCAEALAAAGDPCNPRVSDGCGGFLACGETCESGLSCIYITDRWAEGGGYYSCETPCSVDSDCEPFVPSCYDANSVTIGGTWCEAPGYCTGIMGVDPCTDDAGNPTMCVDGACQ